MQPGVAKGTIIRYIGKSIDDFFDKCGWNDYDDAAYSRKRTPASTDNVIPFQNTQTGYGHKTVANASDADGLDEYISNLAEFGQQGKFVLMQDGSWKEFDSYGELSKKEDYARTSDGYVRLKHVYYSYDSNGHYNGHVDYQLYDFPPQVPEASMNNYTRNTEFNSPQKIRTQSRSFNAVDHEYLDVEIGFKNTEGCKEILVEQTDSDYPVPYTYIADVNQGCFTAFMDRKYTSTFKLTYYNKNGRNEGEPFTIDLRNDLSCVLVTVDNDLKYNLKGDKISENGNINYTLISIANHATISRGNLRETKGRIDISDIPKGIYIFTVNINGKSCSSKFLK